MFDWLTKARSYDSLMAMYKNSAQQNHELRADYSTALDKCQDLQDKLDAAQATIDSMQAVYEQRLHQQENEVRTLKNKAQKPKRNRLSHKDKAELFKQYRAKVAEWKAKNFKLQEEVKKLRDENANMGIELAKLQKSHDSTADKDVEIAQLRAENDTLKAGFDTLEKKFADMMSQAEAERASFEEYIAGEGK